MRNNSSEWLNHQSIQDADAELNEALSAQPFVGSAAAEALAKFVKATETLQHSSNGSITTAASAEAIVSRIASAQVAAENAPDPTYAHIFSAEKIGFEAMSRTTSRRTRAPREKTPTADKNMSGAKS